jgi:hypothetical protein
VNRSSRSITIAATVALCGASLLGPAVHSQVPGVSPLIVGLTGGALIDQANRAAAERIEQTRDATNGVVNNLISQLNVLIASARLNAIDTSREIIGQMRPELQQLYGAIFAVAEQLRQTRSDAFRMEEIANLDVISMRNSLPLISKVAVISSIDGMSIREWEQSHTLRILGSGLALASLMPLPRYDSSWTLVRAASRS